LELSIVSPEFVAGIRNSLFCKAFILHRFRYYLFDLLKIIISTIQINRPIPPDSQIGNEIPVILLKSHMSRTTIQAIIIGINKFLRTSSSINFLILSNLVLQTLVCGPILPLKAACV